MAVRVQCEGIDELMALISKHADAPNIFVLFTGKVDLATGKSWCPDCVKADPVIEKCAEKIEAGAVLITCVVGDRPAWKNSESPFRKNPKLLLKGIPTLVKWNTPERLGDKECADENLVSMLFEE